MEGELLTTFLAFSEPRPTLLQAPSLGAKGRGLGKRSGRQPTALGAKVKVCSISAHQPRYCLPPALLPEAPPHQQPFSVAPRDTSPHCSSCPNAFAPLPSLSQFLGPTGHATCVPHVPAPAPPPETRILGQRPAWLLVHQLSPTPGTSQTPVEGAGCAHESQLSAGGRDPPGGGFEESGGGCCPLCILDQGPYPGPHCPSLRLSQYTQQGSHKARRQASHSKPLPLPPGSGF